MEIKKLLKSFIIWCCIVPCAIINGGLRELLLIPILGEKIAMIVSGLILCFVIYLIAYFLLPKLRIKEKNELITIRISWVILTLVFEFSMGVMNNLSFEEMMKAYDITTGNLWSAIVLYIGFVPLIVMRDYKSFKEQ